MAWLTGALASCIGTIEPAPGTSRRSDAPSELGPQTNARDDLAEAEQPVFPAPPTLHRLGVDELQNTLSDLLGPLTLRAELEPDTALKGFSSIGATELTIANTTAEKLEATALEAAQQVFADEKRRKALLGCAPGAIDDPCVQAFIARFGRRAFRRPLADDERAQMSTLAVDLARSLGDVNEALSYLTAAFLQSPHFVFRVEIGAPDPAVPGRLRYTGYEMASRLSYALWRSMPDDELLAAADEGALATREGVDLAAERMIASPRFRPSLRRFFSENLSLDRLSTLSKEPSVYPQLTPTLKKAMRAELERRFDDLVFTEDGDYRDLLDGRTTFVDAELAKLYGIAGVRGTALTRVELPADGLRAGILGSAALLAIQATATDTSPTRRGKFIRGQILCQEVSPPPAGTNFALSPVDANKTMRERLTVHRTSPSCAGCHARLDPLGLAFENFDGIGAFRATDRGMPIDASGTLDGEPFTGPVALLALLRAHPASARCVVRQLYRFASGHQETDDEERLFDGLTRAFAASGYRLPALMRALVTSDGFRFAASAMSGGTMR